MRNFFETRWGVGSTDFRISNKIPAKLSIVIAVVCCFLFSGCIFIVGGAVGALGGYAISQDTIQGETKQSYASVWKAATEVVRMLGTISVEDTMRGTIEAKVNSITVKVFVREDTEGVVRLRVKARKHLFPKIKLSPKVYTKIIERATK